jgi:hypothetical protein
VVFLLIEFPLRQQKSLCLLLSAMFIFIDTLRTHLSFYLEVIFQFSICIKAWYTLRRLNFLSVISLTSIMSKLSMHKVSSISHDMYVHRTMFIKPIMSHTQSICGSEGVNQSIPRCHHCGVTGHICPNCFQIRSQKPRNKTLAPRKDEPGFEERVKMLSD